MSTVAGTTEVDVPAPVRHLVGFPLHLMTMVAGCWIAAASPAQSQSLGDRFKEMFGVKSQPERAAPGSGDAVSAPVDLYLSDRRHPRRRIDLHGRRPGPAGEWYRCPLSGDHRRDRERMRLQHRHAPDRNQDRVFSGRVIVGPAGAPPAVEVPLRIAVVEDGVSRRKRSPPRPIRFR